ncbi:MAG: hypothetical protein GDA50_01020 [Alphaproteobacteria bacterium GM202ARS2]|nr:hypothetical protein [Alphaproteobacteria bacterium GM202ARS2]
MMDLERYQKRLGVILALLEEVGGTMARTNLMECLYILQSLKRVPLGYRFRLHVYGPYDGDVIEDLFLARVGGYINMVSEKSGTGYRYIVSLRENIEQEEQDESDKEGWAHKYKKEISEVADFFKNHNAYTSFEKYGTLLFIMRALKEAHAVTENSNGHNSRYEENIVEYFKNVKGRFAGDDTDKRIEEYYQHLLEAGWLKEIQPRPNVVECARQDAQA